MAMRLSRKDATGGPRIFLPQPQRWGRAAELSVG